MNKSNTGFACTIHNLGRESKLIDFVSQIKLLGAVSYCDDCAKSMLAFLKEFGPIYKNQVITNTGDRKSGG